MRRKTSKSNLEAVGRRIGVALLVDLQAVRVAQEQLIVPAVDEYALEL